MKLPLTEFPLRRALNDEAHARPPEALKSPQRISFLALLDNGLDRTRHEKPVRELCRMLGQAPPNAGVNHFSCDFGSFRLKWEKHTEFTRYKFIVPGDESALFTAPAITALPKTWLESLPGQLIAATHVELVHGSDDPPEIDRLATEYFADNPVVGAVVADGGALALTDYRIREDGFSRLLIIDRHLAPRQAGRTLQRLLEMDAYRILALMALPVARELGPELTRAENDLIGITTAMTAEGAIDEAALLDRLTRLEAQIQKRYFETASRFSASEAYHRLIQRRTDELREKRVEGLQTFREFVERRLGPAMSTCVATSTRHERLGLRIAQTTQLLSTKVEVSRQTHNQSVLQSMNRRVLLQLRLQQTVEGLSVAAITYYVVGLVSYLAKGLSAADFPLRADLVVAASVPVVAALVAFGMRVVRRTLARDPSLQKSPD